MGAAGAMAEAAITAAASAASSARPQGPSLGLAWLFAAVMLLILGALGWALEGQQPITLTEAPIPMEPAGPSSATPAREWLTPELRIDGPTTVELSIQSSDERARVDLDATLIHLESQSARSLLVSTGSADGVHASTRATALIDRVQSGHYVLRIFPSWQPTLAASAAVDAPRVTLRLVAGASSHRALWMAALLLLLPPLWMSAQRWRTRGYPASAASPAP